MEKTKSTLQLSDSQKSQLVSGIQTKSTAMTIVNNYVEPLNPNQVPKLNKKLNNRRPTTAGA